MKISEILEGLKKPQKTVSSKYLYDKQGSDLFEKITELEEYYPTRTEVGIMETNIDEICELLGTGISLIELGSGSSYKTRLLLDHLKSIKAYYPVDISGEFLQESIGALQEDYAKLTIIPLVADYTSRIPLPAGSLEKRVVYYPGSTIGNFEPETVKAFLKNIREIMIPNGGLLIGVDLKKDRSVLEAAYNDSEGVTAAFNKNLLVRMNREVGADFNPDSFEHQAIYNETDGRIEMYLKSVVDQEVRIANEAIAFEAGEKILTEYSCKYTVKEFKELVKGMFQVVKVWTDKRRYFSVQYLKPV